MSPGLAFVLGQLSITITVLVGLVALCQVAARGPEVGKAGPPMRRAR
jgi:hypothetical protein